MTTPTITTHPLIQEAEPEDAGPPDFPSPSRASTPSTNASKTSFVRPSLALTKLQQDNEAHEEEVEEYSPHDPYFTPATVPQTHQFIHDPGIEPADPQVIHAWEVNLRRRLEQAYPRMCYYFFCDKSLFVLVTLLTLRRIAKADVLNGRPVGHGRRDRQFVDDIAQCMSDAETRYDKDEEWMTWWRETLLTVQSGLQRGWIHADSPVSSAGTLACRNRTHTLRFRTSSTPSRSCNCIEGSRGSPNVSQKLNHEGHAHLFNKFMIDYANTTTAKNA